VLLKMFASYRIALILIAVTLAIFWSVGKHEFVWDDRINITENPYLKETTFAKILTFWQGPYEKSYVPLTYTAWAIIAGASENPSGTANRLDPRPFHGANLFLHVFAVLVVYAIVRRLVVSEWAAAMGALLFGLHPLQVEAVARVAGLKEVLSGLLSLIALWQYLLFVESFSSPGHDGVPGKALVPGKRRSKARVTHYVLATVAFVLALLAKPAAVAMPLIAWMLDYFYFGRSWRQTVTWLGGWGVLAMIFVGLASWADPQSQFTSVASLWARPLIALDALAFYLDKLFLPFGLTVDYGPAPVAAAQWGRIYFMWLLPAGAGLGLWLWRKRETQLVGAGAIFVAGLLPVLGLLPFGFQQISTVADRYVYLALLGPALALAWVIVRWQANAIRLTCAVVIAALGIKTIVQIDVWKDNASLFQHALKQNPNSWLAHHYLALDAAKAGADERALEHSRAALKLNPEFTEGHYQLGNLLAARGDIEGAMQHYQQVLRADPRSVKVYYNLGNALARSTRLTEAAEQFEKGLAVDPANASVHSNLARVLLRQNRFEEAINHYRRALISEPNAADIHYGLAHALAGRGEVQPALDHYLTALRLNPKYAGAYYNVGVILARRGETNYAILRFRQALMINPDFAEAHEGLGRALILQGEKVEGMKHLQEALKILKTARGTDSSQ
jgi:tetratricopeptide (TPR) repeat protein